MVFCCGALPPLDDYNISRAEYFVNSFLKNFCAYLLFFIPFINPQKNTYNRRNLHKLLKNHKKGISDFLFSFFAKIKKQIKINYPLYTKHSLI
jgi:hypothetical protein